MPDRPPSEPELPALFMTDLGDVDLDIVTGAAQFELRFQVDVYVADAGAGLAAALDAGYLALTNALLADRTLGNLAVDLRRGEIGDPEFVTDEGSKPFAVMPVEFVAQYWTAEADMGALAP